MRLYELTYPEIECSKEPVVDAAGYLWGGPDRRGPNAPPAAKLWIAWQRDVKLAGVLQCSRRVNDYFGATLFFNRPPSKADGAVVVADLKERKVPVAQTNQITEAVRAGIPRFTWSPSKIEQFNTCPFQFAARHYYKTLPYEETEAAKWGIRVHKAAELIMLGREAEARSDVEAFAEVGAYALLIKKYIDQGQFPHGVEAKVGVSTDLKGHDYWDAFGRMQVDLWWVEGETLHVLDWKTGKLKDDFTQMHLYALCLITSGVVGGVKDVKAQFIWTKSKQVTRIALSVAELMPVAKELREQLQRMQNCWDTETFIKTPNGLCKKWCAVKECQFCGGLK